MRFTKIKVTDKGVSLDWTVDQGGQIITANLASEDPPLPELEDALEAFGPYVIRLLELPETWLDDLVVTGISIDTTGDENLRGLIVTARRRVENANGRPLIINTPRMPECGENTSDNIATLTDDDIALIDNAQQEATRYVNGERTQGELFTRAADPIAAAQEEDDDLEQAADRVTEDTDETEKPEAPMPAAGDGRTKAGVRKKRKRGTPAFVPGVGEVVNADSTVVRTDEQLQALLLKAGRDIPIDAIAQWTSTERDQAAAWGEAKLDFLIDPKDQPLEPLFVLEAATPSITDAWTSSAPPKVSHDGAQEIRGAIEKNQEGV